MSSEQQSEKEEIWTLYSVMNTFIIEVGELFLVLCIIKYITNKNINFKQILYYSVVLGIVIMIIGSYNYNLKRSIKTGILTSLGAKLITFD